MSRYTYAGDAPVLFSHYLDVTDPEKPPKTLLAEPGKTYEIKQADGLTAPTVDGQATDLELPIPPDRDWRPVDEAQAKQPAAKKKEQADG